MRDFIWRIFIEGQTRPLPRFLMPESQPDIPMPKFWQVMVAPMLIIFYAGLIVTQSWGVLLGVSILLLLGWILLLITRPAKPDDRGGWDDVYLP